MSIKTLMAEIKQKSDELQKLVEYNERGFYSPQELAEEFRKLNRGYKYNPNSTDFNEGN